MHSRRRSWWATSLAVGPIVLAACAAPVELYQSGEGVPGTIAATLGRRSVVIAAPHGTSDARTGDIVHETPGSVHTLVLQEDSEVFFVVEGALEYLDIHGHTLAHEDWRSVTQKHMDFCKAQGLDIVDVARPRTSTPDRVAVA